MNVYDILDHMITAEQRRAIIKHYTEKDMRETLAKQYEERAKEEEKESGFLCTQGHDECVTSSTSTAVEDMVNRPSHYNYGDIECIDAIRAMLGEEGFVAYCKGNALKYTWRAGLKSNESEDLKKSVWYTRMANGDDPRKTKLGWIKDE